MKSRRTKLDGVIILISCTVVFVLAAMAFSKNSESSEHDRYVNELLKDNPQDFGYTSGEFNVSDHGSANYEIPLLVAPGTAGMAPKLSLVYNSMSGNGLMGEGWSLNGLSIISRSPATYVQDSIVDGVDFDAFDRFVLDGQRLVLVKPLSANYGANNTEYRTEQASFKRIKCYGTNQPEKFKVETKSGLTFYYGYRPNSANSRVIADNQDSKFLHWLVDKIEDKNGNYILFEYEVFQGFSEYRPKRILYTGNENANLEPYNLVEFNYKDRNDNQVRYISGSRVSISKLLQGITMYHDIENRVVVRNYRFSYDEDIVNGKSILRDIRECVGEKSDRKCLNRSVFVSQPTEDMNLGKGKLNSYNLNLQEDYQESFIDINYDGFVDKVFYKNFGNNFSIKASINDRNGKLSNTIIEDNIDISSIKNAIVNVGDYDGDGFQDFFLSHEDNGIVKTNILINNCQKDKLMFETKMVSYNTRLKNPKSFITDLNSDGLADLFLINSSNSKVEYESILSRFKPITDANNSVDTLSYSVSVVEGITNKSNPRVLDLNGDGLSDILYTWADKQGWHSRTLINKIRNPIGDPLTAKKEQDDNDVIKVNKEEVGLETMQTTYYIDTLSLLQIEDFNEVEDSNVVSVQVLTIDQVADDKLYDLAFDQNKSIVTTDLNDDGVIDLVLSDTKNGWHLYSSIGLGTGKFQDPVKNTIIESSNIDFRYGKLTPAEINGDGLVDMILYYSGSNGIKSQIAINTINNGFTKGPSNTLVTSSKYNFTHSAQTPVNTVFHSTILKNFKKDNATAKAYASEVFKVDYSSVYYNWSNEIILDKYMRTELNEFKNVFVPSRYYDATRSYSSQKPYYLFDLPYYDKNTNKSRVQNRKSIEGFNRLMPSKVKFICPNDSTKQCKQEDIERILTNTPINAVQQNINSCPDPSEGYIWGFNTRIINDTACYRVAKKATYFTMAEFRLYNFWNLHAPDLNGDGISDLVFSYPAHPSNSLNDRNPLQGNHKDIIWMNNVKKSGLITKIIEGNGSQIDVKYLPITDSVVYRINKEISYPHSIIKAPMYVVRQTRSSNGIGGKSQMLYRYFNGITSHNGRGFWGFQEIIKYHVDSKLANFKYYYSDEGGYLTSDGKRTKRNQFLDMGIRLVKSIEKKYEPTQKFLEIVNNTPFISFPVNGHYNLYFPYINNISEKAFDFTDQKKVMYDRVSKFSYDNYGNQEYMSVNHNDGFTEETISSYVNNIQDWIIGRLDTTRVIKSISNDSDTSIVVFDYDNQTGQLISEENLVNDDLLRLRKLYHFDVYGNAQKSILSGNVTNGVKQDRITETVYDEKGRFVEKVIDPLNYITEERFDERFGYSTSRTDVNRNTSTTNYDDFGNVIRSTDALGNYSESYQRFCQNCPSKFKNASHFQLVRSSIGLPVIKYFDLLSREIGMEHFNVKGQRIISFKEYDRYGQVKHESIPHFSDHKTPHLINYEYDDLGRIKKTIYPNGTNEEIIYNGLSTFYYDALDRLTIERKNARGQLQWKSQEDRDGIDYKINYEYDLRGNLITVKDIVNDQESKNVLVQDYDELNNKTHVFSPNHAKPSVSTYNAFGEVLEATSPGGFKTKFTYDELGRLKNRNDGDIVEVDFSYISYNDSRTGKGQVDSITKSNNTYHFNEYISYDQFGRVSTHTYQQFNRIDQPKFTYSYSYDTRTGLLSALKYPEIFGNLELEYYYEYGILKAVSDRQNPIDTFYQIKQTDALGQITVEKYGNGVINEFKFQDVDNNLKRILSSKKGQILSDLRYEFDAVDNIEEKRDALLGVYEKYEFNQRDQLTKYSVYGNSKIHSENLQYDHFGNIIFKSDVGEYIYSENAVVESINGIKIRYDNEGNRENGLGTIPYNVDYTHFNKPKTIQNSSIKVENKYGPNFDKQWERITYDNKSTEKLYIGGLAEIIYDNRANIQNGEDNTTVFRLYINIGGKNIAYTDKRRKDGVQVGPITYLHHDVHSNIILTTDKWGIANPSDYKNFDPWGQERDGRTWMPLPDPLPNVFAKRTKAEKKSLFTQFQIFYQQHEHLSYVGLVYMGGRIYDPLIAQFLSIDPALSVSSNMGLNSYAYVLNNPLKYIDPSGYFIKKLFKGIGGMLKSVANAVGSIMREVKAFMDKNIVTIAVVGIGIATGGVALAAYGAAMGTLTGSIVAAAGFGFGSAFSGAMFAGASFGDALQAGITAAAISGAAAAVTFGVGEAFGHTELGSMKSVAKASSHGIAQGSFQDLQGGKFEHGFLSGAFTELASGQIEKFGDPSSFSFQRVSMASMVGGTASSLGGGKFANGAISGAMVQAFNHETQIANEAEIRQKIRDGIARRMIEDVYGESSGFSRGLLEIENYFAEKFLSPAIKIMYKGMRYYPEKNNYFKHDFHDRYLYDPVFNHYLPKASPYKTQRVPPDPKRQIPIHHHPYLRR